DESHAFIPGEHVARRSSRLSGEGPRPQVPSVAGELLRHRDSSAARALGPVTSLWAFESTYATAVICGPGASNDHNGRNTKQGRRRPRAGQARLEGVVRGIRGGPEAPLPR